MKKTQGNIPLVAQLVGHNTWDVVRLYTKDVIDEKQDLNVRIINSVGEVIYLNHLNNHIGEYSNSISLESYPKSIYFLVIETDDWSIYRKLILQ